MSTVRSCQCEPLCPLSGGSEHSRTRSFPPLGAHEQHSPPPPAPPRCHGRRCSCLSRLRAMLSSHSPPHCLTLLLALPLSPATSLLLLDWYASSCPAILLSSLPLRPTLATADTDRARGLLDSLPPLLRESFLVPFLRSLSPRGALQLLD